MNVQSKRIAVSMKISLFIGTLLLYCAISPLSDPQISAADPLSTPLNLTPAEQSWLQKHPVIRLAPDPEFKPIEFFDRKGLYQGVAADHIRLLEKKLGIKFSIIKAKNWDEVLTKFKKNEVDLLGAVVATPQRRGFMRISEPLFNVPGVIIVRNTVERELTIDDLKGKGMRVAVVSSYTAHDILKTSYPGINLDVVPDTASGLTKVSFGLVDAYIENIATATHYMHQMGIANVHNAGATPFIYDWGIGIRKDWPELESIINKGIAAITHEERQAALNRWIPITPAWRPDSFFIGSALSATGVLIFCAIVFWNRTLARRVTRNTAMLRKEVDERIHAEDVVRTLNEGLEARVRERTAALEKEIAERQKAQESLQKSETELRIVADHSLNWEFWRLPDDSFPYMSPSVKEFTGYSAEEFNQEPSLIYKVVHPEDRELFCNHTHVFGSSGQILPLEMRIVRKNGEVRWVGHVCKQIFTPDGLPWGWRASNQDITERKQIEHELFEQTEALEEEVAEREAAQSNLEELNRSLEERISQGVAELRHKDQALIQQSRLAAMGEMINNIAHQWRQPLNNVGLIIQNLQFSFESGTITRDELKQEISTAMDVIMHMSHTIDDFRNFFREDKQKGDFSVSKTVHKALEFVSAALSNHKFRIEIEDDEKVTVSGFQNEYAQVLLNILSNSREACVERGIKAPRIKIRITTENGRSVVLVRDNCGGIPNDVLQRIFDPYFTTRGPDKGTGIGLYMSKVIIEQHMNGELTACNIEDGVEFRIEV